VASLDFSRLSLSGDKSAARRHSSAAPASARAGAGLAPASARGAVAEAAAASAGARLGLLARLSAPRKAASFDLATGRAPPPRRASADTSVLTVDKVAFASGPAGVVYKWAVATLHCAQARALVPVPRAT
jgi:hypothetical protein